MSAGFYLENYLDGLESLPVELDRNFKLMRKLDERAQTAMQSIDSHSKEFMRKLADGSCVMLDEDRKERMADIQALFSKAKEYSDDKVQLAIQTYELVDKQIRRLDSDLARFESEMHDKASSTRDKSEEASTVVKRGRKKQKESTKTTAKKKKSAAAVAESSDEDSSRLNHTPAASVGSATGHGNAKKKKQKVNHEKEVRKSTAKKAVAEHDDSEKDSGDNGATHPSDVMDMPVDPNEPTYCLCHQVSYGEMIGCDNPDCPIEWFHFACVGLKIKPKGKWYCPKCSHDRKKK